MIPYAKMYNAVCTVAHDVGTHTFLLCLRPDDWVYAFLTGLSALGKFFSHLARKSHTQTNKKDKHLCQSDQHNGLSLTLPWSFQALPFTYSTLRIWKENKSTPLDNQPCSTDYWVKIAWLFGNIFLLGSIFSHRFQEKNNKHLNSWFLVIL